MANVNKVILIGNVTRDPEVKYTPKGLAVTDIGLAINRNYTLDTGEKREETTFVDIELWGRLAEIAGEYAKKGRSIYIEGRLRLDSWEDKTSGQKRSRLKVVGENLQLLGSRPGTGGPGGHEPEGGGYERHERSERQDRTERSDRYEQRGAPQSRPSRPPQQQSAPPPSEPAEPQDDIPF